MSQRLSRRGALKAGGLSAAAAALAACGGDGGGGGDSANGVAYLTPSADDATVQTGGVLKLATATPFGSLDVIESTDVGAFVTQCHGYLHTISEERGLEPMVAEKFEQPDSNTFIWTIRKGIKFQNLEPVNGREVTVDDVNYSFQWHNEDPLIGTPKQTITQRTDHFGVTGPDTFTLVTKEPYYPALLEFGAIFYPVFPHEVTEKYGNMKSNLVGCGPFQVKEFTRAQRLVLEKNPGYFIEGRPYLDGLEYQVITDEATIQQAFATKRTDTCGGNDHGYLRRDEWRSLGAVVRKLPNFWQGVILLRCDKPPFNDIRLREVIDFAVDRDDLVARAEGEAEISGPIPPSLPRYALPKEELEAFYGKPDYADLKAKLAAAGFPDGIKLDLKVMNVAGMDQGAIILKEQLAKVGVDLNIVLEELGVHLAQTLFGGNYQIEYGLNWPWGNPDSYLASWLTEGAMGVSYTGYSDPVADDMLGKIIEEFDLEKRTQMILDAQRWILQQHGPMLVMPNSNYYTAWWPWVHGQDYANQVGGTWSMLWQEIWLSQRT